MIDNGKSKRELKHSKILQRQIEDLRRGAEMLRRRGGDEEIHSDESEEYIEDRKAKKWWMKFEERHFPPVTLQDYRQMKNFVSSNQILEECPKEPLGLSYAQEEIIPNYDLFTDPKLIHVLYKSVQPQEYCLASYELEQAIPSYADGQHGEKALGNFSISPCGSEGVVEQGQLRGMKLSLAGVCYQAQVCKMVEQYKTVLNSMKYQNELDRELFFWQREMQSTSNNNSINWERLYHSIKKDINNTKKPLYDHQITSIKEYLRWVTVLKYFQRGFEDKTMAMLNALIQAEKILRPSKAKQNSNKKFFQTDCKICFCSLNNDSNQVLYCDSCNTSFHLACYGLEQIPKQEIYYCDCCRFHRTENVKKPICQLCFKSNFPIKNISGHFYHMTCLLLLNLGRLYKMQLDLKEIHQYQDKVQLMKKQWKW